MQIKYKLLVVCLPALIAGSVSLGLWSVQAARDGFINKIRLVNQIHADFFLSHEIEPYYRILKENKLESFPQYKEEYKNSVVGNIDGKGDYKGSYIIWDGESQRFYFDEEYISVREAQQLKESVETGKKQEGVAVSGKKEFVYSVSYFKPWDWTIYAVYPTTEITNYLNIMMLGTVLICSVSVLVTFLLIFVFTNKMFVRPLMHLKKATEKIGKGDFAYQVNIDSRDELGDLGNNIRNMAEKLRDFFEKEAKLADKLIKEKLAAERANAVRSEFLANMSHEIRTPMNGVMSVADLLMDEDLTDNQKNLVNSLVSSGGSMLTILNDILDFSKLESGRVELEMRNFDFHEFMNSVLILFDSEAAGKDLYLQLKTDPSVPRWIQSDSTRIRQILSNLIGNAIKFTARGGITVSVSGDGKGNPGENTELHIEVSDTGCGIEEKSLGKIFDYFVQEDSSVTREFGGTGLGLAISKNLVRLLGGSISARSQKGQGSVFGFNLMARVGHSEETRDSTSVKAEEKDLSTLRVLLVEDNKINQDLAVKYMEKLSVNFEVADNGQEALNYLENSSVDVILMDCQMPVMDGYTATARIRTMDISPVIIAMTAHAMKGDREKCLAAGMDDYLTKPMSKKKLSSMLQKWAGKTSSCYPKAS